MKEDIDSFTTRFIFDGYIKLEINKRLYQMTLLSQCFSFQFYWEKNSGTFQKNLQLIG